MFLQSLIGKTVASVESKEITHGDEDGYGVAKITCTDGTEIYFGVEDPCCVESFYGTLEEIPADKYHCTGAYNDMKILS